jgi:hypothetical protein
MHFVLITLSNGLYRMYPINHGAGKVQGSNASKNITIALETFSFRNNNTLFFLLTWPT